MRSDQQGVISARDYSGDPTVARVMGASATLSAIRLRSHMNRARAAAGLALSSTLQN